VRREVWIRDEGQCTFHSDEGHRCESRSDLELEHIDPKARAAIEGRTMTITAADVRLLCRAHNQLMAERAYGAEFMRHKRESRQLGNSAPAGRNAEPGLQARGPSEHTSPARPDQGGMPSSPMTHG
jgi:5-methylcytosine-specific restriction endonuclease McrA